MDDCGARMSTNTLNPVDSEHSSVEELHSFLREACSTINIHSVRAMSQLKIT